MNRRNFLTGIGATCAGLLIPSIPVKLIDPYPYKLPQYDPKAIVGSTQYLLYQFNKKVGEGHYVRDCSILEAPEGVTKQDIINEIYSKWNDNDALIQTCAATGDYGMNEGKFVRHMSIRHLKDLISDIRTRQLRDVGNVYDHPIRKNRVVISRSGEYIIRTRYWKDGRVTQGKSKLYSVESFAKEMLLRYKKFT